ncbi:hypothetical protein BT63DRAFT_61918 [Microthyrium microscopicum]|uniref:Heterokaryon incompatibility domain-containing protein n=1 Tax=Microthyrium microscopicum TaxID=703497 RepID=A0A6A6U2H0_9PEZI|nr:hypothetical protein BT63DRAFT_61918 [Microthyrium microscopicum]
MEDETHIKTIPNDYTRYHRLNEKKREICLLRILPASLLPSSESSSATTDTVCYLVQTTLLDHPNYEGLSYCWGALENPQSITLVFLDEKVDSSFNSTSIASLDRIAQARLNDPSHCIRDFHVTENLHHILSSYRQNRNSGFLWVDMLSINQGDEIERSHQVGWMTEIYAKASRVVVSLGGNPHTESHLLLQENEDLAMFWDCLSFQWHGSIHENLNSVRHIFLADKENMVNIRQEWFLEGLTGHEFLSNGERSSQDSTVTSPVSSFILWLYLPMLQKKRRGSAKQCAAFVAHFKNSIFSPRTVVWNFASLIIHVPTTNWLEHSVKRMIWPSLHRASNIASHDWFRRIWVLQEVASNKSVVIRHAADEQEWDIVLKCYKSCFAIVRSLSWVQDNKQKWALSNLFSRKRAMPGVWSEMPAAAADGVDVLHLIHRTRNFKSTDPRDKIFALINLAKEFRSSQFFPDYRRSSHDTFIRFTRFLIAQHKSTQILRFADDGFYQGYKNRHAWLPSWVPDYCHLQYKTNSMHGQHLRPIHSYGPPQRIHRPLTPRSLRLEGTLLGRVEIVPDFVFASFGTFLNTGSLLGRLTSEMEDQKGIMPAVATAWKELRTSYESIWPKVKTVVDDTEIGTRSRLSFRSYVRACVSILADERHHLAEESVAFRAFAALWELDQQAENEDLQLDWMDEHDLRRTLASMTKEQKKAEAHTMGMQIAKMLYSRHLFLSHDSRVGLGPLFTYEGDLVVHLHGASVPVILRQYDPSEASSPLGVLKAGPVYKLVGFCYLDGAMDGEIYGQHWHRDHLHDDPMDRDIPTQIPGNVRRTYSTTVYDIR